MQSLRDKLDIAVKCYLEGRTMVETWEGWHVLERNREDLVRNEGTYRGEEIVAQIVLLLFGDPNVTRDKQIYPTVYRNALRLFKIIHINTDPSYRTRPLLEEGGTIKFKRGKSKKKRV